MGTKIQGVTLSLRIRDNLLTNINCTKKKKKKDKKKRGYICRCLFFCFCMWINLLTNAFLFSFLISYLI